MSTTNLKTDLYVKERMMQYLKELGYNFYKSATLLKLSQEERDYLSVQWSEKASFEEF